MKPFWMGGGRPAYREGTSVLQAASLRQIKLSTQPLHPAGMFCDNKSLNDQPAYRMNLASPMPRCVPWVSRTLPANEALSAASQSRRQAAQKAAGTKREAAKKGIAELVRSLSLTPVASRARVRKEAAAFLLVRYEDFSGEVTEKALCSFLRHHYTNYEEILSAVKGKVGAADLYENVKVYLCCRIIAHYGLHVSPLYAAFGDEDARPGIPERFRLPAGEDLRTAVASMLGIEETE